MTVEASFITPVIVILFAAVIFLFVFYHDVSYAKAMTIQVSDEVAQAWKVNGDITTGAYDIDKVIGRSTYYLVKRTSGDVAAQGRNKLSEALSGHLILTRAESSEVSISGLSVVSKVDLSFRWPFPALSRWIGNRGLTFSGKTRVPLEYREELLRMIGGDS